MAQSTEKVKKIKEEITKKTEEIKTESKEEIGSLHENTLEKEVLVKEDLVDDSAELIALEKEIQELEAKEKKEKIIQKQKEDILDFSSEDIWNLGGTTKSKGSDGTIRFAEDIESLNTFSSPSKKNTKNPRKKRKK